MSFLKFLFQNYTLVQKSSSSRISFVTTCSNKVQKNSLFICLKGRQTDGHKYLKQAIDRGASALLLKDTNQLPSEFKGWVFKYTNNIKNLDGLLNNFYQKVSEKLCTIAVTGTNGKTSFCYLLEKILTDCGWPTAVMGTIDHHFKNHKWSAQLTTTHLAESFERLNDFVNLEARAVAMEVSSHALDQNRIQGLDFKAFVFTNLTQDHLDYHKNMETYFQTKKKLFLHGLSQSHKNYFFLFNQDDPYGKRLQQEIRIPSYNYGQDPSANFYFKIIKRYLTHSLIQLNNQQESYTFKLPLCGDYNASNAVAALACAVLLGFNMKRACQSLENFTGVPGRLQKVIPKTPIDFDIFIDYAHTAQALASVLRALKSYGSRRIVVFGCGGDRDKDKRVPMLQAAIKESDHVIFTTDNPRFEDPQRIIDQVLKHFSKQDISRVSVELDRKKAIYKAITLAQKKDIILVAGKGHEQFQIIRDQKQVFCDKTVILEALKKRCL